MRTFDLERRLILFAISTIDVANNIQRKPIGNHLGNQLLRAGTSAALNYAEAQAGESRRDFIHKMKIALKELRESYVCLQIIDGSHLFKGMTETKPTLLDNNELISIFVSSITTAQKNYLTRK